MNFWHASRASAGMVLALWGAATSAAPWEFTDPETIAAARAGVFHHLESAGRQNIAVSTGSVAVVWEDNRDGVPRAYVAIRPPGKKRFHTQQLSGGLEAYEPVVVALPQGGFQFGWVEGGQVWVRPGGTNGLGAMKKLSRGESAQVALGAGKSGVYAAWSESAGRQPSIRFMRLAAEGKKENESVPVTPAQDEDQLYPSLVVLDAEVVVAWEDRHAGHSIIMHAKTKDGRNFSAAQALNEQRKPSTQIGRGPGAARVVLARLDTEQAAAVWLDKRDFLGGYDVYAAQSDLGASRFLKNEMVQDEFGNTFGQWHATLAARPGLLAVAWDDDRDGHSDIWLSWRAAAGWSENIAVSPPGSGNHTSPAMAMDEEGRLLLVWVEQKTEGAPTSLRFREGRRIAGNPASSRVH